MKDEQRFEIERAYDLLPHVVGASWACVWFRLNQIKKPTKEEFYQKTIEYLAIVEGLCESYPHTEQFSEINTYMKNRHTNEIEKILAGKNSEIEKRYTRYIDYG